MKDKEPADRLQWPEPVNTCSIREVGRVAKLSGLPNRLKQVAWREIQQNSPELAELLKTPELKEVMAMFDAELFIDAELSPSLPPEWLPGRTSK